MPPPDSAISPQNLIEKLCFLRFGAGLSEGGDQFRADLYSFLRGRPHQDIKRQSINFWLGERGSAPKRTQAIRFLNEYFDHLIRRDDLSSDGQRQVFDQVASYFRRQRSVGLAPVPARVDGARLYLSNNRRVMIDIAQPGLSDRKLNSLIGLYRLFHVNLGEDNSFPVAREVLDIFVRGRELRFRLFYLRENQEITVFSGVVIFAGPSVWLIGNSDSAAPKMRVLLIRNIETDNERYNRLRWGVMTTDIPRPSSPDPVSCRFVMWRERLAIRDKNSYARENVRNLSLEDVKREPLHSLMRLISNNITALSNGNSPEPATNQGYPLIDEPLKVNQATLEHVADKLSGML